MRFIKRAFCTTVLIVLCNMTMLSAAEKSERIKTVYPVPSAILLDAYRYLGALDYFSFDAIITNDDNFIFCFLDRQNYLIMIKFRLCYNTRKKNELF